MLGYPDIVKTSGTKHEQPIPYSLFAPRVYAPLDAWATFGMYKGLWELFHNPFYWDKTEHGLTPETHPTSDG